jgi:hypothetical protein
LILGINLVDVELAVVEVAPEPMELEKEVLGAVGDQLVCSKKVGALIVLKGAHPDSHSKLLGELHHQDQLLNEALQG